MAATGVGAGDLLAAGLAGSELGTVILWAAVFSSLLGVWQSVPCLFAGFVSLTRSATPDPLSDARITGCMVERG